MNFRTFFLSSLLLILLLPPVFGQSYKADKICDEGTMSFIGLSSGDEIIRCVDNHWEKIQTCGLSERANPETNRCEPKSSGSIDIKNSLMVMALILIFGSLFYLLWLHFKKNKIKTKSEVEVSKKLFCSKCGNTLTSGEKFCSKCGKKVN